MLCWLIECGLSAHTVTHKERKRAAQRRACVAWCVCDGVMWIVVYVCGSVGRRVVAWWIERGEKG